MKICLLSVVCLIAFTCTSFAQDTIYIHEISEYQKNSSSDTKKELRLNLSLPYVNSFRITPENEGIKENTGFWGLSVGLDYYHSKKQFFNLGFSGVSDFFVPFPASPGIEGEYELMTSTYISLSNNHIIRNFKMGYGFSYARNSWKLEYYGYNNNPPQTRDPVKKSHKVLGFVFPIYFSMEDNFEFVEFIDLLRHLNIGIVYRPTFYRPNMTNKFMYEHIISIDFAWKIKLN